MEDLLRRKPQPKDKLWIYYPKTGEFKEVITKKSYEDGGHLFTIEFEEDEKKFEYFGPGHDAEDYGYGAPVDLSIIGDQNRLIAYKKETIEEWLKGEKNG